MKINTQKKQEIQKTLDAIQGNCKVRKLSPETIELAITQAEERLSTILPKTHWRDIVLSITWSPDRVAASYKGIPMASFATVTRFASGWFLTEVSRERVREGGRDVCIGGLDSKSSEILSHLSRTLAQFELEESEDD